MKTQKVTLIVTEYGDHSVGIQDQYFDVVFPFEVDINDEQDNELLTEFRSDIQRAYNKFCDGRVDCSWDFHLKQEAQKEL